MILNTNVQVNNYFSQQEHKKTNKTQMYTQTQISSRGKSKLDQFSQGQDKNQFLSYISNKIKKNNGRNGSLMGNEEYIGVDAFKGAKKVTEVQSLKL